MKLNCSGWLALAPLLTLSTLGLAQDKPAPKETHITPEQTAELFRSVNQILTFASEDSELPIKHEVKRRLITRDEVEKYIQDKLKDDKDAKKMQREEIVLKKFGFLDRDFHLQPFLVSLLKEQIAGYYDSKTKTVNLLDWVSPEEQKPVLAHELTHALQDQHIGPGQMGAGRSRHNFQRRKRRKPRLAIDEEGTARDAVLEGQAMAVLRRLGPQAPGQESANHSEHHGRTDETGVCSDIRR